MSFQSVSKKESHIWCSISEFEELGTFYIRLTTCSQVHCWF